VKAATVLFCQRLKMKMKDVFFRLENEEIERKNFMQSRRAQGADFRRWQKRLSLRLSTASLVHLLTIICFAFY